MIISVRENKTQSLRSENVYLNRTNLNQPVVFSKNGEGKIFAKGNLYLYKDSGGGRATMIQCHYFLLQKGTCCHCDRGSTHPHTTVPFGGLRTQCHCLILQGASTSILIQLSVLLFIPVPHWLNGSCFLLLCFALHFLAVTDCQCPGA